MDVNLDEVAVGDNTSANRYEVQIGKYLAVMTYQRTPGQITFIHTVVPSALAGHGIADKMASHVLEEARAAGLAVIPRCPFVAAYIQRHPEYRDLVPADERASYLGR
jgi:predicted GNAT family acetyltransferase